MNQTSIEWCNRPETRGPAGAKTWNPIRARIRGVRQLRASAGTFCTRISPGCTHCYASTINKRFGNGLEFTVPNLEKIEFFIDDRILMEPLQQKKPCTIFTGDMFDLFHEAIPRELISEVLLVMQRAEQHTFQLLTKRAKRMQEILTFAFTPGPPPPHIWAGVSVEDKPRADERIPLLLQTPAAVRFLSVEPMLEPIMLFSTTARVLTELDWVIVGGESGPGARPFNLEWAASLLKQCRAAGVPFFMKQLGTCPYRGDKIAGEYDGGVLHPTLQLHDRKGGRMSEWPEALRVREFPAPNRTVQVDADTVRSWGKTMVQP